jgi:hypothetical protein
MQARREDRPGRLLTCLPAYPFTRLLVYPPNRLPAYPAYPAARSLSALPGYSLCGYPLSLLLRRVVRATESARSRPRRRPVLLAQLKHIDRVAVVGMVDLR